MRVFSLILCKSEEVKFFMHFGIFEGKKLPLLLLVLVFFFFSVTYMASFLWVLAMHYVSHFLPVVYDHCVCLESMCLTFVYYGAQRSTSVIGLHGDL